ncbi:hypothetical protein FZC35_00825 [Candidatus Cytomitobacter indipagum]|uniref:Uncharacterized protein n=1 Tax=Candidatus Cytomitobacter indipagum TaxID=2601575 RepID=A0A5C0UD19_9PROT|nr:hypothetical protein [Candidatus Cytomitobacter indipagum]QEK37926.1 hypothetical protein FZC35_00825 [Candidatus Cytomitobacter indipagum]
MNKKNFAIFCALMSCLSVDAGVSNVKRKTSSQARNARRKSSGRKSSGRRVSSNQTANEIERQKMFENVYGYNNSNTQKTSTLKRSSAPMYMEPEAPIYPEPPMYMEPEPPILKGSSAPIAQANYRNYETNTVPSAPPISLLDAQEHVYAPNQANMPLFDNQPKERNNLLNSASSKAKGMFGWAKNSASSAATSAFNAGAKGAQWAKNSAPGAAASAFNAGARGAQWAKNSASSAATSAFNAGKSAFNAGKSLANNDQFKKSASGFVDFVKSEDNRNIAKDVYEKAQSGYDTVTKARKAQKENKEGTLALAQDLYNQGKEAYSNNKELISNTSQKAKELRQHSQNMYDSANGRPLAIEWHNNS